MKLTEEQALQRVVETLQTLKESIDWPLHEAFTDLDDHPEEDEDGGFNYNVGYVVGLCEAFGFDVCAMANQIDPPKDHESEED